MLITAIILSTLALVAATISITIQVTIWTISKQQKSAETYRDLGALREPSPEELDSFFGASNTPANRILKEQKQNKLEEAFENPDVPYTGIDEEFNV